MSIFTRIKSYFTSRNHIDPEVEAYLNKATDHADLDRRMHDVNRYLTSNMLFISKMGH